MIEKTNGFLEDYAAKCFSGEIVAGHEIKDELVRLLDDAKSDKFIYDTSAADARIKFIENFAKCTKSPFYAKPMTLLLWQKAFLSALYGFQIVEDGERRRRFKRTLLLIARKNGKSELCSALILSEMFVGGRGLEIVCSSNDDKQASILFNATMQMRALVDPKQKISHKTISEISVPAFANKVVKISEKTQNKEGRNIDIAVIDEVHEMKDNEIVKAIEQSQSVKKNPLLVLITTEGFVADGFLDAELQRARGILSGEICDLSSSRYLPWIYTQDSESEVWDGNAENKLWQKSNPSLFAIKQPVYLAEEVDVARASAADRAFVLSKDFNIKQNSGSAWLTREQVESGKDYDFKDVEGCVAVGGVDLSATTDLTSAHAVVFKNDGRRLVLSMYWIAGDKIERSNDAIAGAHYEKWVADGLVRKSEDAYINPRDVALWFKEIFDKYHVNTAFVGYDVAYAQEFARACAANTEKIEQKPSSMSNPIRMVESDLTAGRIFGLNAVDKWCLSNAALKVDSFGQGMLVKAGGVPSRRIDGAASLCIAYASFFRHQNDLKTF